MERKPDRRLTLEEALRLAREKGERMICAGQALGEKSAHERDTCLAPSPRRPGRDEG